MSRFMTLAGVAAVVAIVIGALAIGLPQPQGGIGGTAATFAPSQGGGSPSPTSAPASPTIGPLETSAWQTYTSTRYDFTIGHPVGWRVQPAIRDWSLATDGDDWLSPAHEAFINPAGQGIRVSAWSVPRDPSAGAMRGGTSIEGWQDLEVWLTAFCEQGLDTPCTGLHERAVPLCLEKRDCHPGLLVPFESEVLAFFTNGGEGTPVTVVAVWWGENEPAVRPYGGSRKLLEAFLSTMNVQPAEDSPFQESRSAAASFVASAP